VLQPNASQWRLSVLLAAVLVLFWPSSSESDNRSLALKFAGWVIDPTHSLPREPEVLGFADEDDVAAIDAQTVQQEQYDKVYNGSALGRLRLRLRDAQEPLEPATERQILIAAAVLGGLLVWRLGSRHS
jgi:hypothetical protein